MKHRLGNLGMTAQQIKELLAAKGLTQGKLRRRWQRPDGTPAPKATVSAVINRKMTSARYDRKLARALGITLEQLRGGNDHAARL
jgi:hypothetical protein